MTQPSLFERAQAIFDRVCDAPPEACASILDEACEGDDELRREVESLLAHDASACEAVDAAESGGGVRVLAEAIAARPLGAEADSHTDLPDRIGLYRVIRRIGEGGMGEVFEAEQESPRRRVALKIIRSGLISPKLVRRFEREAFVLGQLQHPGIAHIYESGMVKANERRQPYFAMELIRGERITAFVKQRAFSTRQRLELMARVCDAVQHAHQKGIIHRDLKPANVLVVDSESGTDSHTSDSASQSLIDSIGQSKVLDFGIARMIDADVEAVTMDTYAGQIVGTLAYMSPEQVAGNSSDLDTRCDVYSLGVILHELLIERRPHDVTGLSVAEAARRIRETTPPRLGAMDRRFRGDVETIVAKALENDRDRRYASAAELATDIRRHLSDQPIDARPASRLYQLNRFAKRNKGVVGGVVAAILALAVGLLFALRSAHVANVATARAESESQRAKEALADVEEVAAFQGGMIQSADLSKMGALILDEVRAQLERVGSDGDSGDAMDQINTATLARAVVDGSLLSKASQEAAEQFADRPTIEADIRESLANSYFSLGLYEPCLREAQLALSLRRAHLGDDHLDTIRMLSIVATILDSSGRTADAEPFVEEALRRLRTSLPEDHKLVLDARDLELTILSKQGEVAEAIKQAEQLVADASRVLPVGDGKLLFYRKHLAVQYLRAGRLDEALPIYEDLLASYKHEYGKDHLRTLGCWTFVAGALTRLERYEEAEAEFEEVLRRTERVLGEFDKRTYQVLHSLGTVRAKSGQINAARDAYNELLIRQQQTLPEDDPMIQNTVEALAALDATETGPSPAEPNRP